jgi:hypothetical protein
MPLKIGLYTTNMVKEIPKPVPLLTLFSFLWKKTGRTWYTFSAANPSQEIDSKDNGWYYFVTNTINKFVWPPIQKKPAKK